MPIVPNAIERGHNARPFGMRPIGHILVDVVIQRGGVNIQAIFISIIKDELPCNFDACNFIQLQPRQIVNDHRINGRHDGIDGFIRIKVPGNRLLEQDGNYLIQAEQVREVRVLHQAVQPADHFIELFRSDVILLAFCAGDIAGQDVARWVFRLILLPAGHALCLNKAVILFEHWGQAVVLCLKLGGNGNVLEDIGLHTADGLFDRFVVEQRDLAVILIVFNRGIQLRIDAVGQGCVDAGHISLDRIPLLFAKHTVKRVGIILFKLGKLFLRGNQTLVDERVRCEGIQVGVQEIVIKIDQILLYLGGKLAGLNFDLRVVDKLRHIRRALCEHTADRSGLTGRHHIILGSGLRPGFGEVFIGDGCKVRRRNQRIDCGLDALQLDNLLFHLDRINKRVDLFHLEAGFTKRISNRIGGAAVEIRPEGVHLIEQRYKGIILHRGRIVLHLLRDPLCKLQRKLFVACSVRIVDEGFDRSFIEEVVHHRVVAPEGAGVHSGLVVLNQLNKLFRTQLIKISLEQAFRKIIAKSLQLGRNFRIHSGFRAAPAVRLQIVTGISGDIS